MFGLKNVELIWFVWQGLVFDYCDGLTLSGSAHVNGPGAHIKVLHSKDVTLEHLTITSPGDSPNTDGIDVGSSTGVNIHNSFIATGE